MANVLLTDGQQRKTLAAARSLGRRGVEVLVAEETFWATSRFSKYCRRGLVCPSPRKRPGDFFLWLREAVRRHSCQMVIPMDDYSLEAIMAHKDDLENICRLPLLPPRESYLVAADKALCVAAARAAGLDCPETLIPGNLDRLAQEAAGLRFPVLVKPRKSSGSRGIALVARREELVEAYMRVHRNYPYPIIQEYMGQGEKFDVCLLFDRVSRVRAAFVQRQVRLFPLEMGPSTVQESVLRPDLVAMASTLLRQLNWQGIADVELMIDPRDGKAKFLELNPRFWSSLQAAILAGVDFPWLLYRLAIGEEVEDIFDYPAGVFCRWLLPGDILHFLCNRNRRAMNPPFFGAWQSGMRDDIIDLEDPLPALGFFLACLRYIADPDMWRFMFRRQ